MSELVFVAVNGEENIRIIRPDPAAGILETQAIIHLDGAPGPMVVDPAQRHLYVGLRSTKELVSFQINDATGELSRTGLIGLKSDPCYLGLDRSGRYLLSAYYHAGAVAIHAINSDGTVSEKPQVWKRTRPYAHALVTAPSNRFAFVPHVGRSNRIMQFLFDAESGRLKPNTPKTTVPAENTGPRHLCFHPRRDWVYASNEQGSSVTQYNLDGARGILEPAQTISTIPSGFSGDNTCAEIHIHPAGNMLFVSNRGHDSIACFAVDEETGHLTSLGQQATESTPRAFNLDPKGRHLYVAGQESGKLAWFWINPTVGKLAQVASCEVGSNPVWVLVLCTGK